MRVPRTLSVYLVRQMLGWTAIGLLAITIVFLSQNLLRMLDKLLLVEIPARDLGTLVACIVAALLTYTVPIAFLFGVMVSIGRMAADSEILALRACGLGLRQLLLPVLGLAAAISMVTAWLLLDVEHRSRRELREAVIAMTTHGSMLEPGEFKRVADRIVFVRSRDRENRLEGVLISDRTDPRRAFMIFAESGVFGWDAERGQARFRLHNGDLHIESEVAGAAEYKRIGFEDFEYAFAVKSLVELAAAQLRPKDMTTDELRAAAAQREAAGDGAPDRRLTEYRLQIHRRYALPFAPLLFALVGVPLAMRSTRSGRSLGTLLCAALVGAYYGALTFSQFLALGGWIPAGLALWVPNLLCAGAAVLLLARARRPGI
jgi:lipopolysaccharide export system permease protein